MKKRKLKKMDTKLKKNTLYKYRKNKKINEVIFMKNKRKEELKARKQLALIEMIELKNQKIVIKNLRKLVVLSIFIGSQFDLKTLAIFRILVDYII